MIALGVKLDLVQKIGSWFSLGDVRLGQGMDAAKAAGRAVDVSADDFDDED